MIPQESGSDHYFCPDSGAPARAAATAGRKEGGKEAGKEKNGAEGGWMEQAPSISCWLLSVKEEEEEEEQ